MSTEAFPYLSPLCHEESVAIMSCPQSRVTCAETTRMLVRPPPPTCGPQAPAGGPQGQEGSAQLCTHHPCWFTESDDPPSSCASSTKYIQIPSLRNAFNKSIKYSFRISRRPSLESYFTAILNQKMLSPTAYSAS